MNIKNLKSDIWEWIDDTCPGKETIPTAAENKNPNSMNPSATDVSDKKRRSIEKETPATFQNMISNIALNNQQGEGQEISVSYYFLCLLHLANEKGLKIEGQTNFADLKITKDF